jgi:hypothetical protein
MILKFLLPYTSAMMQNAAKIRYANFRVASVLTWMSGLYFFLLKLIGENRAEERRAGEKVNVDKNVPCSSSLINVMSGTS